MLTTRTWSPAVALLSALIAAGCGNSNDDPLRAPTQTPSTTPTETPTDTSTPTPDQAPSQTPAQTHIVTASAGAGGNISPISVSVTHDASTALTVTPDAGFSIASVTPTGCTGTLTGNTYATGPITADCAVVARFAANPVATFTVTTSAGAGGNITPTSVSVTQGASAILTVTPNAGFHIAGVTPSGCTGTLSGNTYTTGPITADCAVAAGFAAGTVTTFNVTASAGAGGSITPGSVSVTQGASTILAVMPNSGFSIASVTASGCGGTLAGTTYTTGPITADCVVVASFAASTQTQTHTVTASAGAGGSITPTSVSVTEGASAVLSVTPNIGFSIAGVTPTGCTGTLAGNTYTTEPITANCAVAASFVANTYTVTASAGAGGSITPGSVGVAHGESTLLTVTPDTGFSVSSVAATGCSGTLAATTYSTGAITADCTITASFAEVATTSSASKIAAGGSHSCALTSAGAVQCWGNNFFGELGNGSTTKSLIPVTVIGLSDAVTALVAGAQHTCALTSTGGVQCWGYNSYGQLGNGSTTNSGTPIAVTGLGGTVTALTAGSYHTCALTSAGAVQCWGYNANGQLGNGSTTKSTTPVTVTGLDGTVAMLTAGANHTCALTSTGAAQCWGNNVNGQLGNGSTTSFTTPVTVISLSGSATTLAAGAQHTCALTSTGATQCWGLNANGQLGNGSTSNSTTPVTVTGLSGTAMTLAAGNTHTCVLTSAAAVQCWGGNGNGQLGDGSTTSSSMPVTVTGLSGAATSLAAGYGHNCVVTSAGAVQCWGYNLYGQLGNSSTTNATTPVTVTGLGGSATALVVAWSRGNKIWNRIIKS